MTNLLCAIFGHKWGQNADAYGKSSWYDRCPRCKRCVLRPMSIAFRDKPNRQSEGA